MVGQQRGDDLDVGAPPAQEARVAQAIERPEHRVGRQPITDGRAELLEVGTLGAAHADVG